ncbi:hypothetical protein SELMODRAFT_430108 [Selaginella moellendorffii]|uniref:TF-B3 domain-containing protein n=1 Tax=Selaginella moellendorffii TaxID=88036 RepID=D8T8C7_SELML|nr:B3 domain-containing protein Os11g0197600 [Selaginella moellendorffii]EFJ07086.1 hypothetical protein SELMODRAFT_430108 [Selaginella moellendorffii]|eukprot:XP_002991824.1 B3 domain-containing protein Os11g0197600 [Selaginella moellendorffii]
MAATNSRISFTKIMKKAHMAEMPIPKPVYEKYSTGALRGTVILELGGSDWQVEVGSGSFTTGWKQFCLDNAIKENDSLVFHHQSARRFSVELYSSDGSAKPGGGAKSSTSGGNALAEAMEKVIKECVVHLDEESSLKFVISKVPRVVDVEVAEPSTPRKIVKAAGIGNGPSARTRSSPKTAPPPAAVARVESRKKKKQPLPVSESDAEEEAPPAKRARTEPSKRREVTRASTRRSLESGSGSKGRPSRRKSKVVSKITALEVRVDSTSTLPAAKQDDTPRERKKVAKSGTAETKTGTAEKKTRERRKTSSARKSSSSRGKKQVVPAADSAALAQAVAFKTSNPSTVIVMKKSNIAPCFYLSIPNEFAKVHLPEDLKEFDMVDSTNKAWGVRWLGPPKRAFSGGWCYFAQDHNLQLNDVCVLEMLGENRVRVNIFKADPKAAQGGGEAAAPPANPAANEGAGFEAAKEDGHGDVDGGDGGNGGDGGGGGGGGGGERDLDAVVTGITGGSNRDEDGIAEEEADDDEEGDDEDYDPKEDDGGDDGDGGDDKETWK